MNNEECQIAEPENNSNIHANEMSMLERVKRLEFHFCPATK